MKKFYVKPEMEITNIVFSVDVLRPNPGAGSGGGTGGQLAGERNTGILDDTSVETSGDEGGYKRSLW